MERLANFWCIGYIRKLLNLIYKPVLAEKRDYLANRGPDWIEQVSAWAEGTEEKGPKAEMTIGLQDFALARPHYTTAISRACDPRWSAEGVVRTRWATSECTKAIPEGSVPSGEQLAGNPRAHASKQSQG